MKRELNSWQRLWIATAFVYLLCIIATGFVIMPDSRHVGREMVNRVIDEVHRYEPFAFVGEAPQLAYDAARKEGYEQWEKRMRSTYTQGSSASGFDRIEQDYRQARSELPTRQLRTGFLLVLGWLIPMALLTVLNRAVRWIMLGSRGNNHRAGR